MNSSTSNDAVEFITEEDVVVDIRLVELIDEILMVEGLDMAHVNVDGVIVTHMETTPTPLPNASPKEMSTKRDYLREHDGRKLTQL